MQRKRDLSWLIAIGGIVAGFLLGLWFGSQYVPQLGGADLSRLRNEQQDEYVTLVALGYAQAQDLVRAQVQLDELKAPNQAQLVAGVAERRITNGGAPHEISALAQLAEALGVQNTSLNPYLPTPTVLPTPTSPPPTPTPLPPTATPEPPTATAELPTSTPEASTPTAQPIVISEGGVNLRGGPGTGYPVVGAFADNERATVVGRDSSGAWWQVRLDNGTSGWVFDDVVRSEGDLSAVPVVIETPPAPRPPTATTAAAQPTAALSPTAAPPTNTPPPRSGPDFRLVSKRLWGPIENGGYFDGPSLHCGEKRQLRAIIIDPAGNPLNGVTVLGFYSNFEQVSGSAGPGVAEWVLGNGDGLRVIRDVDGRSVTSDSADGMVTDPQRIPDDILISAGYCSDAGSCQQLRGSNACWGHYSWDVTFQRAY